MKIVLVGDGPVGRHLERVLKGHHTIDWFTRERRWCTKRTPADTDVCIFATRAYDRPTERLAMRTVYAMNGRFDLRPNEWHVTLLDAMDDGSTSLFHYDITPAWPGVVPLFQTRPSPPVVDGLSQRDFKFVVNCSANLLSLLTQCDCLTMVRTSNIRIRMRALMEETLEALRVNVQVSMVWSRLVEAMERYGEHHPSTQRCRGTRNEWRVLNGWVAERVEAPVTCQLLLEVGQKIMGRASISSWSLMESTILPYRIRKIVTNDPDIAELWQIDVPSDHTWVGFFAACDKGPVAGGCRILEYDSDEDAIADAIRLAKAMDRKTECNGIQVGGAKCVFRRRSGASIERIEWALVELLMQRGGTYISGGDINCPPTVLCRVRKNLPSQYRHCLASEPASIAQFTVTVMCEALAALYDVPHPPEKTITIQGVGAVGSGIAKWAIEQGFAVQLYDRRVSAMDSFRASALCFENESQCHTSTTGVFCHCATSNWLTPMVASKLCCSVLLGASNCPLDDTLRTKVEAILEERNILNIPSFLMNFGGVFHAYWEWRGCPRPDAVAKKQVLRNLARVRTTWSVRRQYVQAMDLAFYKANFGSHIHFGVWRTKGGVPHETFDAAALETIDRMVEWGEFPQGASLVDVGCGNGGTIDRLQTLGFHVTGINACATQNQSRSDLKIHTANIEFVKRFGVNLDGIVCLEVLCHLTDLDDFFERVTRSLRPGGVFICTNIWRGQKATPDDVACWTGRNAGVFWTEAQMVAAVERKPQLHLVESKNMTPHFRTHARKCSPKDQLWVDRIRAIDEGHLRWSWMKVRHR